MLANGLNEVLALVGREHPTLPRAWFARLRSDGLAGGVFQVVTENEAQTQYLERHCAEAFTKAAQAVTGRLVTVRFACDTASPPAEPPASPAGALDPHLTISSFVKCPTNRFAYAASIAVSQTPGQGYNPLYLYGPSGVGKSHLLQGIAHSLCETSSTSCLYLSAKAWTAEVMLALEQDRAEAFRRRHYDLGALLLDDVHLLSGCDHSQDELFLMFNALANGQRQIVLAAKCPPADLGIAPRLASRFTAGLVAAVDPPPFEGRLAILRRHAARHLIEAPEEVLAHLAEDVAGSCSDLLASLVRLDSLARISQTPITQDLAREVITQTTHSASKGCNRSCEERAAEAPSRASHV